MEKRQLGATDMHVGVLGFGGAEIGFENVSSQSVERLLLEALEQGLNAIDTAECYPGSEEKIGNAVAHRRKDFYLFTKCGHPKTWSEEDWRPESLLVSIERSIKRLRTDVIDLVQLHSCSLEVLQKGDAIAALERAREKGYTRYIGYSGDDQAARFAIESGRFDTLQTSVNIADQEPFILTLPLAKERKVGVIAKRPIANAVWRDGRRPANEYHRAYWERLEKLQYQFLRTDEASSIALRFALAAPAVATAIVGTAKRGRYQQNAKSIEQGMLSEDQIAQIRKRWNKVALPDWTGQG